MNRDQRKKIKSRQPLKKILALWVVFTMLVIPFANHIGKDDVKAEESGVKVVTDSSVGVTVDLTEEMTAILTDDAGNIIANTTSTKTIYLLEGAQSVKKLILPELKVGGEDVSLGDARYGSGDITGDSTNVEGTLTNNGETDVTINSDTKFAIYARKAGTDKWKLQYVLNIIFVDFSLSGIGLYDDGGNRLTNTSYMASATMKAPITYGATVIEDASVQYYAKIGLEATADEQKNVDNYSETSTITANEDNRGKQVYAYAAVISTVEPRQVLAYIPLGSVHISNDTQAPDISCEVSAVAYQDEGSLDYKEIQNRFIDENNVYYGVSEKYQYRVTVEDPVRDGEDTSGIKSVTATLNSESLTVTHLDSSNVYTIELTKQQATGDVVTVTAVDNKGNSKDYTCLIKIKQATEGTQVTDVTFADDDSWNGLTENKILSHLTAKKQIKVTLESDRQITAVKLTDGTKEFNADAVACSEPSTTRVYTVTANISIPTDLETSELLNALEVKAYDGGSEVTITGTKQLKNILYDAKAPVISNPKLEKSTDNGTTWAEVGSAVGDLGSIVTELNTIYRYAVTVVDAAGESGVQDVYVTPTDKFTHTTGNTYVYNIPSDQLKVDIPYSVAVTASDKAGNVSDSLPLRGVTKIDDTLRVDRCVIIDAAGNDVTSDVLAGKNTNKKYQLEVTASSAYVVKKFELIAGGTNDQSMDIDPSANNQDATSHRYSVTIRFDLPAKTDINALLEGMYLNVTDGNAKTIRYPGNTSNTLGTILYDRTNPTVSVNEANDSTWYKEYTINYTITSGDNGVESPLANASYSLAGSKANVTDKEITLNGTQTSVNGTIAIPESAGITGTSLVFNAQDASENLLPNNLYKIKVDKTNPKAELTVNGRTNITQPLDGEVLIKTAVSDNLTINQATITVKGPYTDVTTTLCGAKELSNVSQENSFTLDNLIGKKAADGDYTVTVNVSDKAGNIDSKTMKFRVDNTIPVVTAKISGGTTAGKQPGKNFDGTVCDYFYRSNVTVELTYEDENIAASGVRVTDNNNVVNVTWQRIGTSNKYQGSYVSTGMGAHVIKINAQDNAGNNAVEKQVVFIKDTEAPNITAVINGGMVYSENMGVVDLTSDATVAFSVNDANEDVHDFNYQLIKKVPDQLPVTADVLKTDNRVFGYTDEADYQVKVYSVDKAGNRSAERNVQFRVDKTAPELQITGTASGSTLNAGTTLTFSMTEAFWWDASGTITITRKANDSVAEAAYKTIDFKPTARVTTMTETLSETGEYQVTFTGKDRVGHTAEAASYTVRIDTGKPIITLSGVSNNDKTTKQVEFQAQIEEDFYLTKSVSIQATRTYLDPTSYKEKTEDLQITGYNPTAATTLIRNTFTEDGIYKIQVTCKDAAGNEDTQEVSFTIDKTKPVIDPKVMSAYEGTLTSFAWDYDLNDIIYDLTVCDAHMYLNGSEYDGTSEIEDGAYELKITAEDELGNVTEETVNFNLDTKAPTFIVTGVEDGEIKNEQYDINVSLQLDEDTLDEVTLNGSPVEIKDNAAAITVTEKSDYKLTMKAHDDAGNEAEQTISFTYGEKSHVLLYVLIGVGVLVVLGGGIAIILAAKKKKNN